MLYPNSEDSDRLHRIYQLIEAQQDGKSNISQSEQMDLSNLSNQTGKSNKSSKSLNEIIKMKPGIKIGSISSLKQKHNEVNDKNESYEIKDLSPIPKKDKINYIKKFNENKDEENNRNNNNNLNKRNNSSGKNILSEQDISADKEVNPIDWEYTVPDKSNEKEKNKNLSDKISPDEMPLKKDFIDEKKNNKIKESYNDSNKKEQKENSYSEDFNNSIDDIDEKEENILNAFKNEDKSIDHSKSKNNIEDDIPEEINVNKNGNNQINENNNLINDNNYNNNNNLINDNNNNKNENDKDKLIINETNKNQPSQSNNKKSIESENSENEIIITNKNENKNVFYINNSGNNTIELSNSIKMNSHNNSTRNNRYELKPQIVKNENKKENENKEENKNEKSKEEQFEISKLTNIQKEKLADDITEQIIQNLLFSEIKDEKIQILPKKSQKFENPSPLISSNNSLNNNQNQMGNESTNNSLYTQSDMSNLNNSIFMRTISEVKKDITLNLYNEKIAPKLLKVIGKEIDKEYNNIIDNIKIPLKVDETQLMNGIMLKDDRILSTTNSIFYNEEIQNKEFINKKILKDFEKVDKEIRNEDNIISDEYYDNILNECVVDAANELIEKERKYGKVGEPIKWSIRNREIEYKYKKDNNSKKNFRHTILKQLYKMINYKMALIAENYDYMDSDQLTNDRDKKFYKSMSKELKEDNEEWNCFDTEETQIKLVLSKVIMDQLLNEVVEILEHVFYSRKEPSKYQSKSIYACEDIPRLFFQNTTENNYSDLNDNMNQ